MDKIESQEENMRTVEDLLEDIELKERDQIEKSALLTAVEHEREDEVELLLKKRANMNIRNRFGCSPLILACEKGKERIVRILVENGADVNQTDRDPSCTYQYPYTQGHREITDLICENGVNMSTEDRYGLTPLMFAAIGNHLNIAKFLIQQREINLNQKDICGNNALTYASLKGNMEISEVLIVAGIDYSNQNIHEKNALHLACEYGHLNVVKLLANLSVDLNLQDAVGSTAFSYACSMGHKGIVEFLIRKGVNMNIENKAGRTPIAIAYLNAQKDVIRILIENNAKLDIKLRFYDSIVALFETDEQKECFLLVRNAIIKSLYDFVHNSTIEQLREEIINLLQSNPEQTRNIFDIDYYFAFKSIKQDDSSSYKDLVEDEEMKRVCAYFSTYEFKEKFIEDILNNLKDQIELIKIGKTKLLEYVTSLNRFVPNELPNDFLGIEINFRTLKRLLMNGNLIDSINLNDDKDLRELEILQLLNLMDKMIENIQEKLNQAQDLFNSIDEALKILTFYKISN